MGSMVVGSVIAGLAGLGGAAIASNAASSNNHQAMAFNAAESAEAREWQRQMYRESLNDSRFTWQEQNKVLNQQALQNFDYQTEVNMKNQKELADYLFDKFQSPEAVVSALRKAGINPSVVYGSGQGGFPSVGSPSLGSSSVSPISGVGSAPGIPSSPVIGSPALENSGAPLAQVLPVVADSMAKLSQSSNLDASTNQIKELLPQVLKDYILKNSGQEIANSYNQLLLELKKDLGNSKEYSEITKNLNSAYLDFVKGDTEKSVQSLNSVVTKLHSLEYDFKKSLNPLTLEHMRQMILNVSMSRRVMESEIASNYAGARLANSSAYLNEIEGFYKNFEKGYLTSSDPESYFSKHKNLLMDKIDQEVRKSISLGSAEIEEYNKRARQLRNINNRPEWFVELNDCLDWLRDKVPTLVNIANK